MTPYARTAIPLFLASFLGACAATTSPEQSPSALSNSEGARAKTSEAHEGEGRRRGSRRGAFGLQKLLRAARKDPSLSVEQTAKLDLLGEQRKAQHQAAKATKNELRAALAKGVADGTLQDAEVAESRAKMLSFAVSNSAEHAKTLNELHRLLDPAQRKALVERMQAKHGEHAGRGGHHAKEGGRGGHHAKEGGRGGRGAVRFMRELDLDQAQRAALRVEIEHVHAAGKPSAQAKYERREQAEAAMVAFTSEAFDATALPIASQAEQHAAGRIDGRVAEVRAVLTVLRPDQVTKLASALAAPDDERREDDHEP